jgi:hypothetical protein
MASFKPRIVHSMMGAVDHDGFVVIGIDWTLRPLMLSFRIPHKLITRSDQRSQVDVSALVPSQGGSRRRISSTRFGKMG